nr:hypothetical protein MACL_00002688 [Theileria orientalis]
MHLNALPCRKAEQNKTSLGVQGYLEGDVNMNLNNSENYEEFYTVRVNVAKRSRSYERSSKQFRIFDSSHNISQILKFLPFYERLGLRVVNSKWNLSFYFPECWESLDFRFFDLAGHEFYLTNFKRFIAHVKKLDIRIDQISQLNRLICLSQSADLKCVNSISDSNSEPDIIETDNECQLDTDFGFLNPCSNDFSNKHCNLYSNENTFEGLKGVLKTLRSLGNLQIKSQVFSTISSLSSGLSSRFLPCNINRGSDPLDSHFHPCGLHTLVIDSPVDVHFILQITPLVKNIRNLVISRVRDHSSICSVLAEILEHIPRNQLLSLQIGRTIFNDSHRDVEFSTSARARRFNRLNFAYKSFGTTNLEEGDEIISVLLSSQIDSLRIIIVRFFLFIYFLFIYYLFAYLYCYLVTCLTYLLIFLSSYIFILILILQLDDIEISLPAYRQIRSFK